MNAKKIVASILAMAAAAASYGQIRALSPSPRDTNGWWHARFEAQQRLVEAGGSPVVFIGDSITHFWESHGKAQWTKYFAGEPYRALNLGISADRTEHVLWRIDHGCLDGYEAKAIVLMIGTNNTGHFKIEEEPPSDTIIGIRAIIGKIREKQPGAKIVLCAIFPRGWDVKDQARIRNAVVNKEIAKFADGKNVFWCDFTDQFLMPNGDLKPEIAPDWLHPRAIGYEIWANAIIPYLNFALEGKGGYFPSRYAGAQNALSAADGPIPAMALSGIGIEWNAPSDYSWLDRLESKRNEVAASNGEYDLVLLGDATFQRWEEDGKEVLDGMRKTISVLDMGFTGDRTENILWRAKYGCLDGYKAKAVAVVAGGECGGSALEIASGAKNILDTVREKQPGAKVLLVSNLPRGAKAEDGLRKRMAKYNEALKPLADGDGIVWIDVWEKFIKEDGTLDPELAPDGLKPTPAGYEILRSAILSGL